MGTRATDHVGRRFGRLTVLAEAPPRTYARKNGKLQRRRRVYCICECGTASTHDVALMLSGHTTSCGCFGRALRIARFYKHGGKGTPEFNSWRCMRKRCLNPNDTNYRYYGGRGIGIFPAWINDFAAFRDYVGLKPSPSHSLDRFPNPDGNYEPGNVRWATKKEQIANQSLAVWLASRGRTCS